MDELISIARIVRTRGLRGEVVAEVLTDFPDRFENLQDVSVVTSEAIQKMVITEHWFQKNRIILKFQGIDSIEDAEKLRNSEVCVFESETIELGDDEFFDWNLIDCEVSSIKGEKVGVVREVLRTGGTDVLIVADSSREVMIPFAKAICVSVDIDKKLILVDPPDGLFDF